LPKSQTGFFPTKFSRSKRFLIERRGREKLAELALSLTIELTGQNYAKISLPDSGV
jgi:hypothetical protein